MIIYVQQLLTPVLKEIPTTDPNSLFRPIDPFQKLTRIYRLNELKLASTQFEKPFVTSRQAVALIKTLKLPAVERLSSWLCLRRDIRLLAQSSYIGDIIESELIARYEAESRPMSPVLSLRSIRATPRLPKTNLLLHQSYKELLTSQRINVLPLKPEDDQPRTDLPVSDILYVLHASRIGNT